EEVGKAVKKDVPVIVVREIGKGHVVLVGDTGFAMNKNLERRDGRPIEGMRENAHFWRWLMGQLTKKEDWWPPQPEPVRTGRAGGAGQ
ncbi:MAG: hypothetical protein ACOC8E_00720, partial [Planctomycetota bacterium]